MIALVDCNNFFASCERVFNPSLQNTPIAVLSNNDGCIVARSDLVKKIGVPMGAPVFKYKALLEEHNVKVFSSNFSLYADISKRVMSALLRINGTRQIYSVDEAFLDVSHVAQEDLHAYAAHVRECVLRWTGIPVSVGIAETKTLAKASNEYAKKHPELKGVCVLDNEATTKQVLTWLQVDDIWGVGRRLGPKLHARGIDTAHELIHQKDALIRGVMGSIGLNTVRELRGVQCVTMQREPAPKKGIISSRSFSKPLTKQEDLEAAVATFVARAAEKIRSQGSLVSAITVSISTNRFKKDDYYHGHIVCTLPHPTAYTPDIVAEAHKGVAKIFQPGRKYKRAGISFFGIIPDVSRQHDLFGGNAYSEKHADLMKVVDTINSKHGSHTIKTAAQGTHSSWGMTQENRSRRYTTQWEEIPIVHA